MRNYFYSIDLHDKDDQKLGDASGIIALDTDILGQTSGTKANEYLRDIRAIMLKSISTEYPDVDKIYFRQLNPLV